MKNKVLWFTGLSGSGKTTLATLLCKKFKKNNISSILLDGDEIRKGLCSDLGFLDKDRSENIRRIAKLSRLLLRQDYTICVALISPFEKDRQKAREIIGKNNFIEIFCNSNIKNCIKRDVKGLYKKAKKGEIKNLTGISSNYEVPNNPNIELHTDTYTIEECINLLWEYFNG